MAQLMLDRARRRSSTVHLQGGFRVDQYLTMNDFPCVVVVGLSRHKSFIPAYSLHLIGLLMGAAWPGPCVDLQLRTLQFTDSLRDLPPKNIKPGRILPTRNILCPIQLQPLYSL